VKLIAQCDGKNHGDSKKPGFQARAWLDGQGSPRQNPENEILQNMPCLAADGMSELQLCRIK
jgi:hypothetical protein